LPIGWDREHEERTAGIRTFPLVAMGSCGLMLVILAAPDQDSGATSRVLQGLITGIGFVGGGAILRRKEGDVHGIATAASIWNMAIVGAAVGLGLYEIAVAMTAIDFVILRFLFPLKKRLDDQR
ncbi:MAG TPA: MgtC/SapB family protein, partial [Elusimicrobiota bacterium]|nr:MgtC/SapB family protein [Elusimicrobiota bacterium]